MTRKFRAVSAGLVAVTASALAAGPAFASATQSHTMLRPNGVAAPMHSFGHAEAQRSRVRQTWNAKANEIGLPAGHYEYGMQWQDSASHYMYVPVCTFTADGVNAAGCMVRNVQLALPASLGGVNVGLYNLDNGHASVLSGTLPG